MFEQGKVQRVMDNKGEEKCKMVFTTGTTNMQFKGGKSGPPK